MCNPAGSWAQQPGAAVLHQENQLNCKVEKLDFCHRFHLKNALFCYDFGHSRDRPCYAFFELLFQVARNTSYYEGLHAAPFDALPGDAKTLAVYRDHKWDDVGLGGLAYACTKNCTTGCFGEVPRFALDFCPAWDFGAEFVGNFSYYRGCGGACDTSARAVAAEQCVEYFD